MRIAVFGATGTTGRPLVEQALAAGHDVTALVRDPARLPVQHERLHLVPGDVRDLASVEQTVQGQDAVISVIGQVRGRPSTKDVMTVAADNLVTAMQKHGVRRLIALAGAGVPDEKDAPPPIPARIMMALLKLMAKDVLVDAERHAQKVRASDLDWTIVRVPRLSKDPAKGNYQAGFARPGFAPLARADVAAFLLEQLDDRRFLRQAPILTYR